MLIYRSVLDQRIGFLLVYPQPKPLTVTKWNTGLRIGTGNHGVMQLPGEVACDLSAAQLPWLPFHYSLVSAWEKDPTFPVTWNDLHAPQIGKFLSKMPSGLHDFISKTIKCEHLKKEARYKAGWYFLVDVSYRKAFKTSFVFIRKGDLMRIPGTIGSCCSLMYGLLGTTPKVRYISLSVRCPLVFLAFSEKRVALLSEHRYRTTMAEISLSEKPCKSVPWICLALRLSVWHPSHAPSSLQKDKQHMKKYTTSSGII